MILFSSYRLLRFAIVRNRNTLWFRFSLETRFRISIRFRRNFQSNLYLLMILDVLTNNHLLCLRFKEKNEEKDQENSDKNQ